MIIGPFVVQDLNYSYDKVGNVNTRVDIATNRGEQFFTTTAGDGYDGLDRLKTHKIGTAAAVTVAYDQKGNITNKSDVGAYTYGTLTVRPHAVATAGANSYTYDANGNMLTGGGRTLEWTSFNQLKKVTGPGNPNSEFFFGASRERVKQVRKTGSTLIDTTIYAGALYERITPASGSVEHRHYIVAPTGRVAVRVDRSDLSNWVNYFHTDGLGSITVVSDEKGAVVKRFAYDAWGKQSTLTVATPWTATPVTSVTTLGGFTRGYTDHEMLADVGLIHMNGRVYDPVLARFLSADPNIDGASDAQGFNRYSYVGNNPLGATDPTGYFSLKDFFKIVAIIVVGVVTAGAALYAIGAANSLWAGIVMAVTPGLSLGQAIAVGAGFGFGSGFAGSLLNGGSLGDAFKAGIIGGLIGGITAGITHGIGTYAKNHNWDWGRTSLAHGLAHGGISEATGGEFRHGFYSGFFSSAAAAPISNTIGGGATGQTIAAAIVGGTASAIGGGKFANGAVSGAFTYLFNQLGDHSSEESSYVSKVELTEDELVIVSGTTRHGLAETVPSLDSRSDLLEDGTTKVTFTLKLTMTVDSSLTAGSDLYNAVVKYEMDHPTDIKIMFRNNFSRYVRRHISNTTFNSTGALVSAMNGATDYFARGIFPTKIFWDVSGRHNFDRETMRPPLRPSDKTIRDYREKSYGAPSL